MKDIFLLLWATAVYETVPNSKSESTEKGARSSVIVQ